MPDKRPECFGKPITVVLFDLDGTLADTAPDLAYALNRTLEHFAHNPLSYEQIRPHVSHGGMAMIRAGFGIDQDNPDFDTYRRHFLDIYLANIARETTLFQGMDIVIDTLEKQDIPWGIVTNKPAWLTDPLLKRMSLTQRAACIISGDTTPDPKPHPRPILHACEMVGKKPEECLYVGDAARDIEAGRRAGAVTLTALFGYLGETDQPDQWGADGLIEHPLDILQLLGIENS